jgi:hypothetical protein
VMPTGDYVERIRRGPATSMRAIPDDVGEV